MCVCARVIECVCVCVSLRVKVTGHTWTISKMVTESRGIVATQTILHTERERNKRCAVETPVAMETSPIKAEYGPVIKCNGKLMKVVVHTL